MRIFALIISFALTGAILYANEESAQAETNTLGVLRTSSEINEEDDNGTIVSYSNRYVVDLLQDDERIEDIDEEELEPEPIEHIVKKGETLTAIAKDYDTEWIRLWHANEALDHPDILAIDQELIIPFADEVLEERQLPEPEIVQQLDNSQQAQAQQATSQPAASQPANTPQQSSTQRAPQGSTSGNLYAPGYCTWYVKNKRPDLPNNLGNANTWVSRASSQGYGTGSTPRVGAVAYQPASSLGHVAYVEAVHNDGTVTVSEMNWRGLYVVTERRVAASTFTYIY